MNPDRKVQLKVVTLGELTSTISPVRKLFVTPEIKIGGKNGYVIDLQ